jgi:hypothetical protein
VIARERQRRVRCSYSIEAAADGGSSGAAAFTRKRKRVSAAALPRLLERWTTEKRALDEEAERCGLGKGGFAAQLSSAQPLTCVPESEKLVKAPPARCSVTSPLVNTRPGSPVLPWLIGPKPHQFPPRPTNV